MEIEKIETNLKRNLLLHSSHMKFLPSSKKLENQVIRVNPEITFQKFLGFGGAFTESSSYVLNHMVSKDVANEILKLYFSKDNLNYQFGRISIGSCDFSLDRYSYSYQKDLSDFSIQRDLKYIIPTIKSAQKINRSIQFLASPWSPPAFMKTNHSLTNGGKLLSQYKMLWTKYLMQYVLSYEKQGISIDYMTIQNEPQAKQIWESCLYSASEEADLLKNYLFPIFKKNGIRTQFFIWDHNKDCILERAMETLVEHNTLAYAKRNCFSLVYRRTF